MIQLLKVSFTSYLLRKRPQLILMFQDLILKRLAELCTNRCFYLREIFLLVTKNLNSKYHELNLVKQTLSRTIDLSTAHNCGNIFVILILSSFYFQVEYLRFRACSLISHKTVAGETENDLRFESFKLSELHFNSKLHR